MAKCIEDRLAADAINFVAKYRMKGPAPPLYGDAKGHRRFVPPAGELILDLGEHLVQAHQILGSRSQPLQRVAPLRGDASHQLQNVIQSRSCGRIRWNQIGRDVQLHGGAQETLEERVMKLTRDSRALLEPLFKPEVEPTRHLPHADSVGRPKRQAYRQGARQLELPRGPPGRQDPDSYRGAISARRSTIGAGLYPEDIIPRGQRRESYAALCGVGVVPVRLEILENIPVA